MKKNSTLKKIMMIALIMIFALATLVGCAGSTEEPVEETPAVTGTVVIAGSTSVQPLSDELAAAFMDKYPDISVEVQGGGSGQGIKAIAEKIADIGSLSRNVKDEEKASVTNEYVIALDGVAVIVNPDSSVTDLTKEQIQKIYMGEITNWKEVGGDDAKITVVSREEGSGTRGAFVELTKVMVKNDAGEEVDRTTVDALIQGSTGAVKQTVASTPDTIGYISLGSLDDTVKAVNVEGIAASKDTVIDGTYAIQRPFLYVTGGELSEAAQMYIDFVMSDEGQAIVGQDFIPIP